MISIYSLWSGHSPLPRETGNGMRSACRGTSIKLLYFSGSQALTYTESRDHLGKRGMDAPRRNFFNQGRVLKLLVQIFPGNVFMVTGVTPICKPLLYSLAMSFSGQRHKLSETHFIISPTEEPWQESCTVISEIS